MAHLPTFPADYPGAIVVPAAKYGYSGAINRPRAWGLHTPEEPPDDQPSTPYYFHNLTDRNASTTYFVSYLGFIFQMVPEDEGAYGNAVQGKPYPSWADPTINLNLQTLSVEIEGYAATIHRTMPRGSAQWNALVALMAHRCKALGIPPERAFGHYEVSNQRGDPGALDIAMLVSDVKAKMQQEEDDMPLNAADKVWLKATIAAESKKTAEAALKKLSVPDVTEIRNALRGGDLPGLWWQVKGQRTIWYIDYVEGVFMRHHAKNPQSYLGAGGNWKVIQVSADQLAKTVLGVPMPDLKV